MQLEVSDLVFSYGDEDVLKGVSFCADRGERIAVLGTNGVGKSTLFRRGYLPHGRDTPLCVRACIAHGYA